MRQNTRFGPELEASLTREAVTRRFAALEDGGVELKYQPDDSGVFLLTVALTPKQADRLAQVLSCC